MRTVNKWQMLEHTVCAHDLKGNPFWDIAVTARFDHVESGSQQVVQAFHDGRDSQGRLVWRVRWTPAVVGAWTCRIDSTPANADFEESFEIRVRPSDDKKGFLRADPSTPYGFRFDNGDAFFLFGDTMYNLFGAHHCGVDIEQILRHRRAQGINYVRSRLQVSPYHRPKTNEWQNRDLWPWGGSAQTPDFTSLNTAYFRSVDQVVEKAAELGMGIELILEAWLFEFPFTDRGRFLPEHEEMWFDYAVARYSAYPCVYVWCPANEYEYYPKPKQHNPEAERWIDRLCKMIREKDPFSHPIGVHNWGRVTEPLSERIGHLSSFDVYLFQTRWSRESEEFHRDASLCMWLESDIRHHIPNRDRLTVCAEFGYERVEGLVTAAAHEQFDEHHTRRGQWRAGFTGVSVIHGFNNTWAPFMRVDKDASGAKYLPIYFRFMTEVIDFASVYPADELFSGRSGSEEDGNLPLCIASDDRSIISVYFPASGECALDLDPDVHYETAWFNPRNGTINVFSAPADERIATPDSPTLWEDDWVLLIQRTSGLPPVS